jgi:hypothetical protein
MWRLIEVCSGQTLYYIQRIKVADTTPPAIACPDTVFANTSGVACLASLAIPAPVVTDACSEFSYTVWVSAGVVMQSGNQFSVSQLPPGDHILRYTATDACFNQSTCLSVIHVEDISAPVAVCDQHTITSLSAQKVVTTVPALSLSDQSYDACSDITVYGRRMTSCIDFDWTTLGTDDTPDGNLNETDFGTAFNTHIPFAHRPGA